ncbi:hypothetical protein JTB14_037801 [Gonioctena quinquepunctata]|nr:hypothetical protein JTB14_037801 [Gonioctena quinquepunctata]
MCIPIELASWSNILELPYELPNSGPRVFVQMVCDIIISFEASLPDVLKHKYDFDRLGCYHDGEQNFIKRCTKTNYVRPATNFRRASEDLPEVLEESNSNKLPDEITSKGIDWIFRPATHMGGT